MKKRSFLKLLGAALPWSASSVFAQSGSNKTIRVIVPLQAGSSNDMVARVL